MNDHIIIVVIKINVHCTLSNVHCALSLQYTVYYTVYSVYCMCIVYSIQQGSPTYGSRANVALFKKMMALFKS